MDFTNENDMAGRWLAENDPTAPKRLYNPATEAPLRWKVRVLESAMKGATISDFLKGLENQMASTARLRLRAEKPGPLGKEVEAELLAAAECHVKVYALALRRAERRR